MFSVRQKREIAEAVQGILRATGHPELPKEEIRFRLYVDGEEAMSEQRISVSLKYNSWITVIRALLPLQSNDIADEIVLQVSEAVSDAKRETSPGKVYVGSDDPDSRP